MTDDAQPEPADDGVWRALWWGSALPTVAVGAVAVVVSTIVGGMDGFLGAVIGVVTVLAFFGFSLAVMKWTAKSDPMNALGGALLSYVVKIMALALMLVAFRNTTLFDVKSFGFTVLACAAVWLVAELRAFTRAQIPVVNPDRGDSPRL